MISVFDRLKTVPLLFCCPFLMALSLRNLKILTLRVLGTHKIRSSALHRFIHNQNVSPRLPSRPRPLSRIPNDGCPLSSRSFFKLRISAVILRRGLLRRIDGFFLVWVPEHMIMPLVSRYIAKSFAIRSAVWIFRRHLSLPGLLVPLYIIHDAT